MTRPDLLRSLIAQAALNGFDLAVWFRRQLHAEWPGEKEAVEMLAKERRYYALLFSHSFARAFWREGTRITFMVPGSTYSRLDKEGKLVEVSRKPFTRRTLKPDVWKYHLREMATFEEPLRYIRRFLMIAEEPQPSTRKRLTL